MTSFYSADRRVQLIRFVEMGASARAAARKFHVGKSTAVRWVKDWKKSGIVATDWTKVRTRSPLNEQEQWLISILRRKPDLTLVEIRDRLRRERGHKASISSIWRFMDRKGIQLQKKYSRKRED